MAVDVTEAFQIFSTLRPPKELDAYFEVIELVLALLEASKDLVFLSFKEFAKVHGPNLSFGLDESARRFGSRGGRRGHGQYQAEG